MREARLFLALDFSDQAECDQFLERIFPHKDVKIGMELFYRLGPQYVRELSRRGYHVFLDLKCHDIPRTVARAVAAVRDLGVELLTIHAAGGLDMLVEARQSQGTMGLVAVSVLTSIDDAVLMQGGIHETARDLVASRTRLAREAGIDGVVAAGDEVPTIRDLWPGARIVVPGVRMSDETTGGHRRVIGPREAVRRGATDLVVGRSITQSDHPLETLERFRYAMQEE